jgi:hypothetical protein
VELSEKRRKKVTRSKTILSPIEIKKKDNHEYLDLMIGTNLPKSFIPISSRGTHF